MRQVEVKYDDGTTVHVDVPSDEEMEAELEQFKTHVRDIAPGIYDAIWGDE
jgi:hypothetical protein